MKTPSVVLDAFFPATVKVAGLVLKHRFSVKHWLALEKIQSPLVTADGTIKLLDAVRALYIAAMDPAEVFEKVSAGREQFEKDALDLAGRIPLAEAAGLTAAVMRHINKEFVTARPGSSDAQEGDGDDASPLGRSKARRGQGGSSRSSRKSAKRRSTSTRQ